MTELVPLFVAVPLGLAFFSLITSKVFKKSSDILALGGMVFLLWLAIKQIGIKSYDYFVGGWKPFSPDFLPIGIQLHIDKFSVINLLIIQVVGLLSVIYALSYMERYTAKPKFYALFLLMIAGMNGVVITGDLFNLFVFLEIASLATYALVGYGVESDELEAAFKYLVLGSVASAMILLGIAIIYANTSTLNMVDISAFLHKYEPRSSIYFVYALFIMGFGLKAALVPFHAWLPDAHPSAPAPISAMLSGVVIKALGIYAIARIFFNVFGADWKVGDILLVMGALTMLVGVFLALGQMDIKRLLAYHSISQMGYVFVGFAVGAIAKDPVVATLGITGGIYHAINHAVFKSCLFPCSGSIEYGTGTRDLKHLGGLFKRMPMTSTATVISSLSISGIPPFNGFWSKLIIIIALIQAKLYIAAGITILVSFMTLLSFIKVQRRALFGTLPENLSRVKESPFMMVFALIVLSLLCLGLGLGFSYIKDYLQEASMGLRELLVYIM